MDFRKKPQRITRPEKINLNVTTETRERLERLALKRRLMLSEVVELAIERLANNAGLD